MLKQSIVYLAISILVVLFAKYVGLLIVYIDLFYTYINIKLSQVFRNSGLGFQFREIVTLVFLPVMIAAVPALLYWLVRKKYMPYYLELTWVLWLIILLSKIIIR